MKIEIKLEEGMATVAAVDEKCGIVAIGDGKDFGDAVHVMLLAFAKHQAETLEALRAGGLLTRPEAPLRKDAPS